MARSLQVKTLKGESFQIEVAPEAVMSDVKTKISEQRGVDPASQVLICGGKTLKDGDALSSSVATGGFLVLMVKAKRRATPVATKPSSSSSSSAAPASAAPAAAAAAAAAPPPPTSSTSATPPATAATTAPPAPAAAGAAAAAAAATPAAAAASTSTPTGAVGQGGAGAAAAAANAAGEGLAIDPASVEMLTAMGFPEDQARAALRAAFNDVSRAASYLMEGIPEGAGAEAAAAAAAGAPSDSRDGGGDEEGEDDVSLRLGGEGGGNPLNFMRFHPQFDQLRGLVRDNPAMLPQVLQQLGAQSPELMERINEHPGDFLRLMNEPPDVEGQAMMEIGIEGLMDGMEQEDDDEADAAAAGFAAGGGGGGQGQGQQVTVELTQEEEAAVQNLMSMVPGVGRDQVIEAFIACDKNAEMAANLLFENAF